jgi:hypothetical protein
MAEEIPLGPSRLEEPKFGVNHDRGTTVHLPIGSNLLNLLALDIYAWCGYLESPK